MGLSEEEKLIRQLVRAAKKAIKELEWAMPGTPTSYVWNALFNAVKRAERTKLNGLILRQRRANRRRKKER